MRSRALTPREFSLLIHGFSPVNARLLITHDTAFYEIIFIDKGTCITVKADYYINKVLKPVFTKDVPRLFPGREGDMVFHLDLASSHTVKKTIDFLNKRKIKYTTPKGSLKVLMPFHGLWSMGHSETKVTKLKLYTVELQWLEHLWDHGNLFEIGVVRATEG